MTDYTELKRAADAATQGHWDVDDPWVVYSNFGGGCTYLASTDALDTDHDQSVKNASFIAAANPAAVLALIAENDANKERADAEQESYDSQRRILDAVKAERDQLKAENEALRKDAERYRWIKKESNLSDYEDCYNLPMVHAWDYKPGPQLNEQFDSLDSAIDAAMGKEAKS